MERLQKIIVLCIGIMAKKKETKYINKRVVTAQIKELARRNTQSFSVMISTSYKSLFKKELISLRGNYVALNKSGLALAKQIRQEIVDKYDGIDWDIIRRFYEKT